MIHAHGLSHWYGTEQVLYNLDLSIESGSFTALRGESGSGKSTLLSILSTLLMPTEGTVTLDGRTLSTIRGLDAFRQQAIGFVFQFHYLINYLSVRENLELAAIAGRKTAISGLLDELGIGALSQRLPEQLSGGQRQRVAVARALVNEPKIIFADEPTGSLDSKNSVIVYDLLKRASETGATVVVATHDTAITEYADRVLEMCDGKFL
jgi:ABC-type lipoprotein export system ATPase subunit